MKPFEKPRLESPELESQKTKLINLTKEILHTPKESREEQWGHVMAALESSYPNIPPETLVDLQDGYAGNPEHQLFLQQMLLDITPDSSEANMFMGHRYRDAGRLEDAAAAYKKTVDLLVESANRPDTRGYNWADLGDALRSLGNLQRMQGKKTDAQLSNLKARRAYGIAGLNPEAISDKMAVYESE